MQADSFPPDTLCHYILKLPARHNSHFLSVLDKNGNEKNFSSSNYFDQIAKVTKALLEAGIQRGERIALFANTRHEWSVCELASIAAGAVVVPLYPNTTTEDLIYILNHSQARLIFVENRMALRQLLVVNEQCPHLELIVLFEPPLQPEAGVWMSFNEFISGAAQGSHLSFNFEHLCLRAKPNDPVTIIYTSGTTGQPKGVVLNHSQVLTVTLEVFAALQMSDQDHTLSFLPYSHILGRTEHWGNLVIGYSMTYSAGLERLSDELQKIAPTVIVAVPRVFEKIFTQLKSKVDTSAIDSSLFQWSFRVGSEISQIKQAGGTLSLTLKLKEVLSNKLVLNRLKDQLFGSRLRFAVCGGAPLSEEIFRFFHSCGLLILEGYGLTETTGAICVNRAYDFEFGTVGKPLNQTKIKLSKDGEILVQGPTMLTEYYRDPKATARLVKEGWLHTGDIGEITPSGRLIIKDRKKDLIKTANGKYVAPQKLEGMLKQLPFVSHAHIHGDQRKYIVALLTLNKNYIFLAAREHGLTFKTLEDLKEHPQIKTLIREGVAKINLNLASHESIKNYAVLAEDFSVESGEITPSLKVKRKVIDAKYKTLIDSLYGYQQ